MTRGRAFAIAGLSLAIAGAVGTGLVRYVSPAPMIGAFGFGEAAMVGFVLEGLSWASIGALLVIRRPDNAVGWLMVVVGAGYALSMLTASLTFAFMAEGTAEGGRLAQIGGWVTVLLQLVGVCQVAIGFLFPNGRVHGRNWARFMRVFWAFAVGFVVISLIQPGSLQVIPALQNPFGFGPDLRGGRPMAPILVLFTVIIFGSLGIAMVSRYRSADRIERQQQKWFVLSLGLSAVGLALATWEAVFMDGPASGTALTVYVFAGAVVPLAIGIAILRHHLYDIDRIISRTIAYGVVTAALAGAFAATALILGSVLGSQGEGQNLQIAGATLLVVALFGPVRRRAQTTVDRRFDRAHYDAARTIGALTVRLRDDVDLDRLETDVLSVVDETFHPAEASVWLRARTSSRTASSVTISGHRRTTMTSR